MTSRVIGRFTQSPSPSKYATKLHKEFRDSTAVLGPTARPLILNLIGFRL